MSSVPHHKFQSLRYWKWSPSEKRFARKAFDLALGRELQAVMREAKDRAAQIQQPSELWELEELLQQRRKQIDDTYDYRYSVLLSVFAALIRRGRLTEKELDGLAEDKLAEIRSMAKANF